MSKIVDVSNRIKSLMQDIKKLQNDNKSIIDSAIGEEYNQIFSELKKWDFRKLYDRTIDLVRPEILYNWKIYCDDTVKLSVEIFNSNPTALEDMHHNLSQTSYWLQQLISLDILDV